MATKNYGFVKPEYIKPDLSTKLYVTTYSYLKRFYSTKVFEDICVELGMPIRYLLDADNWVSIKFGAQFAQKVREKTGDDEIYRKIGNFYLSPENISLIEYSIIKNLTPHLLIKTIKQFSRKSNSICNFEIFQLGMGKVRFEVTSDQPMYRDMALNTLGIAEAFQKLYSLENFAAKLTLPDTESVYKFSISVEFSALRFYTERVTKYAAILILGSAIGWVLSHTQEYIGVYFAPILTSVTIFFLYLFIQTKKQLTLQKIANEEYVQRAQEKNVSLYDKSELLERRYKEAELLKKLSAELVSCHDPRTVIETCLNSIQQNFGYKKAAIFLVSEERSKMYLAHSIGFHDLPLQTEQFEFIYPNPDKKEGFIATVVEQGKTTLIFDVETYKSILKPHNRKLLEVLKVGSLIISPIQSGTKKFGAFILIREVGEKALDQQDKFLIENITSQFSLYFESASNYANEVKLRSIFQKYVPSTVLDQISRNLQTANGALSPQKKSICSIFMDLRGFTAACDGAQPEKAFLLINTFADFITQILASNGAIIDNIIGDEIVSFFVYNVENPLSHLAGAIESVLQVRKKFPELQKKLSAQGFAGFKLGIGLHCGEASIGSVGSDAKMNFTALGNTVNIASRLQTLSKMHPEEDVTILASKEVCSAIFHGYEFSYQVETLRGTNHETKYVSLTTSLLDKIFEQKPLSKVS